MERLPAQAGAWLQWQGRRRRARASPLPPPLFPLLTCPPPTLLPHLQHAERESRAYAAAMVTVARIQAERGEDEEGGAPDPVLAATCLNEAREAEGLPPVEVPGAAAAAAAAAASAASRVLGGTEEEEEEEEEEEKQAEQRTAGLRSSSSSSGGGGSSSSSSSSSGAMDSPRARKAAAAAAAAHAAANPPAPRKRLTAVLFADSNTHVLLTGDAGGRVDVYRVQGVALPGEELDTTARVDALLAALKTLA